MKRLKFVLIFAAIAALCLQAVSAFAATEFSDGVYTVVLTEQNTALISDCNLTNGEIEVPEFVLGYPVAGIRDYAFMSNSSVTSVTLPGSIYSIGEYAFAENPGLQSVTIPRWCEVIADNAFFNSPNVTVKCLYGSAAHAYAKEKEIPCELLDNVMLGDTNGDGNINIIDVTAIQRHIAGLVKLEGIYLAAADTNCSGDLNITDATTLQKYIAGYGLSFPIGECVEA